MQKDQQISEQEMQRKGRKVLLLMLIFFIVPIVVVILMYKFNWKPNGVSLGELVSPARLIDSSVALKNDEGASLAPQFWKEKWTVVYVAGECEKVCLDKLQDMRQLHVSLYKDIARAQRVLLTTSQDVTNIKHDYPDLIVINQSAENVIKFSQQFQVNDEDVTNSNRLYLVDPLGHLMMSYQPDTPLSNVRKDLTRLLRFSWAG
ncbi:MAG: hypothetical protein CVU27_07715 [Betaproteobacteria bacterium HGW-Betaproteobacteria-20]|nr:MAG: hypothetical protein CVU27_07715 [Betaproteobacteria bacterium HGW-Betaproteobacteria-20]